MSADAKPKFKKVLKAAENAFKFMHEKGGYKAEDIKEKPYQSLINETYKTFQSAVTDNDIPPQMLAKLENDTFIFSGLRTHAQLLEASSFLRDEKGQIRNFDSFANQFNQINKNYNQNYLEAEWQFAVNSSQSAANWAVIDENGRYNLQYRTANDDRVRADHAALQNITLPVDDTFWLSYYPPNGWRCRCTAVEVLKTKYELSDSAKSNELGDRATTKIGPDGKNRMEIFRFNPGAEQKVFPPKHPYNKVEGAKEVKDEIKKKLDPEFTPKNIGNYEKKLGINVNREIFSWLQKETTFKQTNPKGIKSPGAYYLPNYEIVKIPFDDRRKNSKWYAEAVVYHEFGHAADWQNKLKTKQDVKDVMKKYTDSLDFPKVDKRLRNLEDFAFKKRKIDLLEKIGAASDTLMSLNTNYGSGHPKAYFDKPGNKEAEFLAHAFENTYAGNEVFKKVMPELYEDMKKLIDKIKPK